MHDDAGKQVRMCRAGDLPARASRRARRALGLSRLGSFRSIFFNVLSINVVGVLIVALTWNTLVRAHALHIVSLCAIYVIGAIIVLAIGRLITRRSAFNVGKAALLKEKICPSCGYDLAAADVTADRRIQFSECGSTWQTREDLQDILQQAIARRDAARHPSTSADARSEY